MAKVNVKQLQTAVKKQLDGIQAHLQSVYKVPVAKVQKVKETNGKTTGQCEMNGATYRFSIERKGTQVRPVGKKA